jgi:hypothetical protein
MMLAEAVVAVTTEGRRTVRNISIQGFCWPMHYIAIDVDVAAVRFKVCFIKPKMTKIATKCWRDECDNQ